MIDVIIEHNKVFNSTVTPQIVNKSLDIGRVYVPRKKSTTEKKVLASGAKKQPVVKFMDDEPSTSTYKPSTSTYKPSTSTDKLSTPKKASPQKSKLKYKSLEFIEISDSSGDEQTTKLPTIIRSGEKSTPKPPSDDAPKPSKILRGGSKRKSNDNPEKSYDSKKLKFKLIDDEPTKEPKNDIRKALKRSTSFKMTENELKLSYDKWKQYEPAKYDKPKWPATYNQIIEILKMNKLYFNATMNPYDMVTAKGYMTMTLYNKWNYKSNTLMIIPVLTDYNKSRFARLLEDFFVSSCNMFIIPVALEKEKFYMVCIVNIKQKKIHIITNYSSNLENSYLWYKKYGNRVIVDIMNAYGHFGIEDPIEPHIYSRSGPSCVYKLGNIYNKILDILVKKATDDYPNIDFVQELLRK